MNCDVAYTSEKSESEKVEWSEIKLPDAEIFSPPVQETTPQISEPNIERKKVSDPRLNRVCTLTLNGKVYDNGEIPASYLRAGTVYDCVVRVELSVRGLERLLDALDRLDAVERLENSGVEMAYVANAADYRLQRSARDVRLDVL